MNTNGVKLKTADYLATSPASLLSQNLCRCLLLPVLLFHHTALVFFRLCQEQSISSAAASLMLKDVALAPVDSSQDEGFGASCYSSCPASDN